jgi:uncharacterized protein (DUF1800 family)
MELFSLGVGNFTETDIREAARAFTGWRTDGDGFVFESRLHDGEPKTVFGRTGAWDGSDVIRIVLEQPAAARFLVRKLYHDFVSEHPAVPDALLEPLCVSFRRSGYDIAQLVRTILESRHFYSSRAFRQRITTPVEYVLGAVRAVYRQYRDDHADFRPLPQRPLIDRLAAMGQQLFAPPNVKGWPGGRSWLNTSTVLERDNFAGALALGTLWREADPRSIESTSPVGADAPEEPAPSRAFDPARLLAEERVSRPDDIVRVLLDLYLPGGVRTEVRSALSTFVARGNPTGAVLERRVREVVHAIFTTSEYQLA